MVHAEFVTPPSDIRMVVSMDVAQSLMDILSNVGGPPSGYRGDADDIRRALSRLGINANDYNTNRFMGEIKGKDR